jgi:hypothetical protein
LCPNGLHMRTRTALTALHLLLEPQHYLLISSPIYLDASTPLALASTGPHCDPHFLWVVLYQYDVLARIVLGHSM